MPTAAGRGAGGTCACDDVEAKPRRTASDVTCETNIYKTPSARDHGSKSREQSFEFEARPTPVCVAVEGEACCVPLDGAEVQQDYVREDARRAGAVRQVARHVRPTVDVSDRRARPGCDPVVARTSPPVEGVRCAHMQSQQTKIYNHHTRMQPNARRAQRQARSPQPMLRERLTRRPSLPACAVCTCRKTRQPFQTRPGRCRCPRSSRTRPHRP